MSVEAAMRARYAACGTYEDTATVEVVNRCDGASTPRGFFRSSTLFDRATGAYRFEYGGRKAPWGAAWRMAGGEVRVWADFSRQARKRSMSIEAAVSLHSSRSRRASGVVASMLLPAEITRLERSGSWTYREEVQDELDGEPVWRLTVGDSDVARIAWVDRTFTLRKLMIRDQSIAVDYETKPATRRSTTIETTLLYAATFDATIASDRFSFTPPR